MAGDPELGARDSLRCEWMAGDGDWGRHLEADEPSPVEMRCGRWGRRRHKSAVATRLVTAATNECMNDWRGPTATNSDMTHVLVLVWSEEE